MTLLLITTLLTACGTAKLNHTFSELKSNPQTIEGRLVIHSNRTIKDCEMTAKHRILEKLLYEGYENTSMWRPMDLKKQPGENSRKLLYNNIYITELSIDNKKKTCRCRFQLNLASTRNILENEGIIPAFGY